MSSPGIDIKKCKLKNLLKKKNKNIYTDLDVFYSFYKNVSLTITGTNAKHKTQNKKNGINGKTAKTVKNKNRNNNKKHE